MKWASLFTHNLVISGDANFGHDLSEDTVVFMSTIDSDILPTLSNSYKFGSDMLKWQNIHTNNMFIYEDATVHGDVSLTGEIHTNKISTKDSGNVVIDNDLSVKGNLTVSGDVIATVEIFTIQALIRNYSGSKTSFSLNAHSDISNVLVDPFPERYFLPMNIEIISYSLSGNESTKGGVGGWTSGNVEVSLYTEDGGGTTIHTKSLSESDPLWSTNGAPHNLDAIGGSFHRFYPCSLNNSVSVPAGKMFQFFLDGGTMPADSSWSIIIVCKAKVK